MTLRENTGHGLVFFRGRRWGGSGRERARDLSRLRSGQRMRAGIIFLDTGLGLGRVLVNAEGFRRIALSMPEAVGAAHGGHPDFRVGKRIFATLGYTDAGFAMVKLTPEQQSMAVAAEPRIFLPVLGGWGRQRPPPKRSARRTA